MEKTNIGIVGLGTIAENYHIPVLATFEDVRIEAAAEVDAKRRKRVKEKWNIPKVYESDVEMCGNATLDAVFVCAPNAFHEEIVDNAIEHGLHVFCEKPFGLSSDKAYEFGRMAKEKGLILTVGYNKRLGRNYEKATQAVQDMRLGKVTHLHGVFLTRGPHAGYMPKSDWFFEERSGGVLYDLGSHLFDMMTGILSQRVVQVSAQSVNVLHLKTFDNVAGFFKTEGHVLGTFKTGWQAATDGDLFLQINGTGGSLSVDSREFEEIHGSYGPIDKVMWHIKCAGRLVHTVPRDRARKIDETYIREDRTFIDSVRGKGKPFVQIDEAIHVLEVLEAAKESIRTEKLCEIRGHPRVFPKYQ
jgi:predicted dehydrogenase